MKVVEIFKSIQGEGVHHGKPAIFIRFAGCNLTCEWCDTKSSWIREDAQEMTIAQIVKKVRACDLGGNANWIVFTGGEPLLQSSRDIRELTDKLKEYYKIAVETNGTVDLFTKFRYFDHITCSPKPPEYKIEGLGVVDEFKFVVTNDFKESYIPKTAKPVILQPEAGDFKNQIAHAYDICMSKSLEADWRVGIQLHKVADWR